MTTNSVRWDSLGFPVILVGFRMKTIRGFEVPDVNMNEIQKMAFQALITFPHRLTGSHTQYLRNYLNETKTKKKNLIAA